MNKQELYEVNTDIMRYKNNKASYMLSFLAIVCDVAMFIIMYCTKTCTPNVQLGIDLLVNVIFLLACFLTAEKVKVYDQKWGIASIVIGVIEAARIFWLPLEYHNWYLADATTGLPTGKFIAIVVLMLVATASLVVGGIIAILRGKRLNAYLEKIGAGK